MCCILFKKTDIFSAGSLSIIKHNVLPQLSPLKSRAMPKITFFLNCNTVSSGAFRFFAVQVRNVFHFYYCLQSWARYVLRREVGQAS
jgi:hypothetical protein